MNHGTFDDTRAGPRTPITERFWSKVEKGDGCWLWRGAIGSHGRYGQFNVVNRSRPSHRVAWELVNGPIPAGLYVLHRCDVGLCVNPAHLFLGTQKDNMADMMAKGRQWSRHRRS